MILIISDRPEKITGFESLHDTDVAQHVGWKLVGAVRVTTERGGLIHALVFELGGARAALFWDRGSVRFKTAPFWGAKGDQDMHNVACSCAECQINRLHDGPMAPRPVEAVPPVEPGEARGNDDAIEALAGLQLRLADLIDEVSALRARSDAIAAEVSEIGARLLDLRTWHAMC